MYYPYNDDNLVFNFSARRYILTAAGVANRLAIDLEKEFKDNVASSVGAFLNQISLQVYTRIHSFSVNNDSQDLIIAKSEAGRAVIQQAMEQRLLYMITRETMYLDAMDDILLRTIPEIGTSVCYCGRLPDAPIRPQTPEDQPDPEPTEVILIDKNITANGTYYADDDHANGYKKVEVTVPVPDESDATATAEKILEGYTAYVNNQKVTGVIPSYSGATTVTISPAMPTTVLNTNSKFNTSAITVQRGFFPLYDGASRLGITIDLSTTENSVAGYLLYYYTGTLSATTIKKVNVPANVLSIGDYAFACRSDGGKGILRVIPDITFNSQTPPFLGSTDGVCHVFDGTSATIYVPTGYKTAYLADNNWAALAEQTGITIKEESERPSDDDQGGGGE